MTTDNEYNLEDLTRNFRTKLTVCECGDGCGCWLFSKKNLDAYGYAKFKIRGKTKIGHRYAYEALVLDGRDIPDDLVVDHLCSRHRNCCNPAHMELVTALENTLRANDRRWHGTAVEDQRKADRSATPPPETNNQEGTS